MSENSESPQGADDEDDTGQEAKKPDDIAEPSPPQEGQVPKEPSPPQETGLPPDPSAPSEDEGE